MRALAAVFARELRLALRRPAEWAQAPVFYGVVVVLFALAAAPRDPALVALAPSVVWVGALLAALLGIERVFRGDLEDGNLEQLLLAPTPAPLLVASKIAAHWLLTALPLVAIGPLVGAALGLPANGCKLLFFTLLLGTPTLMLIGGFAGALTVGVPRAGLLLPILVLPLMTPVAIFAGGAVRAALQGLPAAAPLYFLAALLLLAATLLPWVAAAALRNALE
ncbi:MAG: heme exporter protein CcmB [Gammaproteobacteria bacterium]|nr:heme exporter protein CcmB [Gammaproteobacteria bacterium]